MCQRMGELLREFRTSNRYQSQEIAFVSRLWKPTYSGFETGRLEPTVLHARNIIKGYATLGIDAKALMVEVLFGDLGGEA